MESKMEKPNTTEETATKHRGWKAMPYIIGNEAFEKLGTIGTSSNLLVYLTTVFRLRSVEATMLLNVFNGTANLAPLLGAFLSDTYFGRYISLAYASMASVVGMLILTLTSGISKLHPPQCEQGQQCAGLTPWQFVVLLSSFGFLIIGSCGIRPCNLAFGADQFNPHTESGKKGISSFFNWYYFTLAFAVMISSTVIIYIQSDVSWTLGFALPTLFMFFSCVFFFVGTKFYVIVKPEGSPFTNIAQVLVAAFRKRRLELPGDPKESLFNPPHFSKLNSKLTYTDQFRFLDKASIVATTDNIKSDGTSAENPWRLSTLQQVEEVKCLLRIIPIWSAGLVINIAMVQQGNYVVFQALQSDRHLGSHFKIPGGSFAIFTILTVALWIPLYDRVIVPRLERYTGKEGGFTLLQRMGIGLFLSIVGTVVFGLVEVRRRSYAIRGSTIGIANGGGAISSLSSLWLIIPLAVFGIAEAFNNIAQIEFYYKQFPENMRSIAGSLFFFSLAISNYISSFMVSVVHITTGGKGKESWLAEDLNEGRLDYFYFLIAAMGVLNSIYFIGCATWYRYKVPDGTQEVALEVTQAKSPV